MYAIIKGIAGNPDTFWMNIKDYIEFFNLDQIKEMEQVGKYIKQSDRRKVNIDQTSGINRQLSNFYEYYMGQSQW